MSAPNQFQQFFPCIPDYMSWEDWNGNLAIYYGQKNIMFTGEEHWQEGAMNIVNSETFGNYAIPNPATFNTWQEWALEFTQLINGPNR